MGEDDMCGDAQASIDTTANPEPRTMLGDCDSSSSCMTFLRTSGWCGTTVRGMLCDLDM